MEIRRVRNRPSTLLRNMARRYMEDPPRRYGTRDIPYDGTSPKAAHLLVISEPKINVQAANHTWLGYQIVVCQSLQHQPIPSGV